MSAYDADEKTPAHQTFVCQCGGRFDLRKLVPDRAPGHPWADFLEARIRALAWLRDEMEETPEQMAKTMSMDPMQVRLILATGDAPKFGDADKPSG